MTKYVVRGDVEVFKKYRLKMGYTQERIAEMLKISTRHFQRIENEENEPSLELFKKIVKVLEIEDIDIVKHIKK